MGFPVRAVGFGEAMTAEPKWGFNSPDDRKRVKEDKVVFVNRRAQMYGEFSEALNPTTVNKELPRYAIPAECQELIDQLEKIPKIYDERGRLWLPPKHRKNKDKKLKSRYDKTLTELIGKSPDEADSAVLIIMG